MSRDQDIELHLRAHKAQTLPPTLSGSGDLGLNMPNPMHRVTENAADHSLAVDVKQSTSDTDGEEVRLSHVLGTARSQLQSSILWHRGRIYTSEYEFSAPVESGHGLSRTRSVRSTSVLRERPIKASSQRASNVSNISEMSGTAESPEQQNLTRWTFDFFQTLPLLAWQHVLLSAAPISPENIRCGRTTAQKTRMARCFSLSFIFLHFIFTCLGAYGMFAMSFIVIHYSHLDPPLVSDRTQNITARNSVVAVIFPLLSLWTIYQFHGSPWRGPNMGFRYGETLFLMSRRARTKLLKRLRCVSLASVIAYAMLCVTGLGVLQSYTSVGAMMQWALACDAFGIDPDGVGRGCSYPLAVHVYNVSDLNLTASLPEVDLADAPNQLTVPIWLNLVVSSCFIIFIGAVCEFVTMLATDVLLHLAQASDLRLLFDAGSHLFDAPSAAKRLRIARRSVDLTSRTFQMPLMVMYTICAINLLTISFDFVFHGADASLGDSSHGSSKKVVTARSALAFTAYLSTLLIFFAGITIMPALISLNFYKLFTQLRESMDILNPTQMRLYLYLSTGAKVSFKVYGLRMTVRLVTRGWYLIIAATLTALTRLRSAIQG